MSTSVVRIGIAGCGLAARIHLDRLLALDGVEIAGCSDLNLQAARELADRAVGRAVPPGGTKTVPAFADHRELLRQQSPQALAIFTPHLSHYRLTMDALQAGCHVFIEKPLSTNVQEAADIVSLARGRGLLVGVGHQFRLCPSLIEARRRLAAGAIGPVRMVTAVLARPWLGTLARAESNWRFDPKAPGSGILADAGDHLIDALLWTTGQAAREVGALQSQRDPLIDLVTAATIRLADGTPVALAVSGVSPGSRFALTYYGERGRLHATDRHLELEQADTPAQEIPLSPVDRTIDSDFVAALQTGSSLCCPAEEALETVRLLEAIGRSATTGQFVRII
jgi:predicted dehydrogenase